MPAGPGPGSGWAVGSGWARCSGPLPGSATAWARASVSGPAALWAWAAWDRRAFAPWRASSPNLAREAGPAGHARSEHARAVEEEGDRPAVHQADVHHGAEHALLDLEAALGDALDEVPVEPTGLPRRRRRGESGPPPAPRVAVERELRHHQYGAPGIEDRPVH